MIRGEVLKKYNIKLLINSRSQPPYWVEVQSVQVPKIISLGVMQVGDRYFNSINVEELIILEN